MSETIVKAVLGTAVLLSVVTAVVLLAKWDVINAQAATAILSVVGTAGGQALVRELRLNGSGRAPSA